MDTAVFLNQKRVNVCEHMTKMVSLEFLKGATRGLQEEWKELFYMVMKQGLLHQGKNAD